MGDFYFLDSIKGFHPGEFDMVRDIITMAFFFKVVKRGGAWYNYEEYKWQGRDAMEEKYAEYELQEEIRIKTLDIVP